MHDLGITSDVCNVNGGAIALGHPIGMSGTRIALTLALELRRRGGGLGAARSAVAAVKATRCCCAASDPFGPAAGLRQLPRLDRAGRPFALFKPAQRWSKPIRPRWKLEHQLYRLPFTRRRSHSHPTHGTSEAIVATSLLRSAPSWQSWRSSPRVSAWCTVAKRSVPPNGIRVSHRSSRSSRRHAATRSRIRSTSSSSPLSNIVPTRRKMARCPTMIASTTAPRHASSARWDSSAARSISRPSKTRSATAAPSRSIHPPIARSTSEASI